MNLSTIIGSAQVAERRFSFYVTLQLASVLAPGIVIAAEVVFLVGWIQRPSKPPLLLSYLKGFTGTAGLLVVLMVVAAGYVTGYITRELAFKLLRQFEKLPAVGRRLEEDLDAYLQEYFPESLIIECLQAHQALSTLGQSDPKSARNKRSIGGGHFEVSDYEKFVYAKLWIRNYASGFSIDGVEAEINILASALIPSLLAAADIIAGAGSIWWAISVAVVLVGLTWSVLLDSLIRLRKTEKLEAVRNLVMDYAMRVAADGYPSSQGLPDQSE
jgi:hypothetical protein